MEAFAHVDISCLNSSEMSACRKGEVQIAEGRCKQSTHIMPSRSL